MKLLKYFGINKYTIDLEYYKQLLYKPIYSLKHIELKTFKTYINIYLANNFMQLSNYPIVASIIFIKKSNSSIYLYINYQNLNNLTIKN